MFLSVISRQVALRFSAIVVMEKCAPCFGLSWALLHIDLMVGEQSIEMMTLARQALQISPVLPDVTLIFTSL